MEHSTILVKYRLIYENIVVGLDLVNWIENPPQHNSTYNNICQEVKNLDFLFLMFTKCK